MPNLWTCDYPRQVVLGVESVWSPLSPFRGHGVQLEPKSVAVKSCVFSERCL
jgi:hypothetical protein